MSNNGGNVPRDQPNTIDEILVRMDGKIDRLGNEVANLKRRVAAIEAGVPTSTATSRFAALRSFRLV